MKKILCFIFLLFILVGCKKDLPKLDSPSNLNIENNIVNFNKVDNASHYVISINNKLTTITDNKFELTEAGVYVIKVKAQAKGYTDSDFSDEITHYILGENPNFKYIFNLKSNMDLVIYDLTVLDPTLNLSEVSEEHLIFNDNKVILKKEYLKTLNIGVYDHILTINDIPFAIQIEVINNDNPYLMINSNYYFNKALDIIVRFDNLGSTIQNISGDELTSNDYTLDDNELIINKEFIEKYFTEHNEYDVYILTIQFKKDNQTFLARVWIHNNK